MIDSLPWRAAHQPPNRLTQTPSRLIPRWNHEPGSRLTPRWTRLYLAAVEFLRYKHEEIGPLFYVMLPSMFQALELLSKAVALKINPSFDPKKDKHKVLKVVRQHSDRVPVFQDILDHGDAVQLFTALERAYFGVRYGECVVGYDAEDHELFTQIAYALLFQLHVFGFRWAAPAWRVP